MFKPLITYLIDPIISNLITALKIIKWYKYPKFTQYPKK